MRIKSVPSGWNTTSLGSIAKYVNGYAFQPRDWGERGLPIIRIAQMQDAEAKCDYYSGMLPAHYRIDSGDLLFSWSATLMTLIWDRGPAYVNQHIFKVVSNDNTDLNFLHHFLNFHMDGLGGQSHGTTMKHIKRSDLIPYGVSVPPLPEQRCIAEILDTLDEAIRKTEQVIAKLQQMKQGLLHDLLTRGIDDNGELRDPDRHPEQFKDSPLGRIPREWRVSRLGELIHKAGGIVQTGPFGSQLHAHEYVRAGVPVIMPQDIRGEAVDVTNIARISERKATELKRHRLQINDAVFARRGDLTRCVAIDGAEVGWLCGTGCLLVRAPGRELLGEWLTAVYRHEFGQRQVLARAVGSTMVNLNGTILGSMHVPIPSSDEQLNFVAETKALIHRTAAEQSELEKLRTLKHGLMDDLLTGRVRVPVPEEATP